MPGSVGVGSNPGNSGICSACGAEEDAELEMQAVSRSAPISPASFEYFPAEAMHTTSYTARNLSLPPGARGGSMPRCLAGDSSSIAAAAVSRAFSGSYGYPAASVMHGPGSSARGAPPSSRSGSVPYGTAYPASRLADATAAAATAAAGYGSSVYALAAPCSGPPQSPHGQHSPGSSPVTQVFSGSPVLSASVVAPARHSVAHTPVSANRLPIAFPAGIPVTIAQAQAPMQVPVQPTPFSTVHPMSLARAAGHAVVRQYSEPVAAAPHSYRGRSPSGSAAPAWHRGNAHVRTLTPPLAPAPTGPQLYTDNMQRIGNALQRQLSPGVRSLSPHRVYGGAATPGHSEPRFCEPVANTQQAAPLGPPPPCC